MIGEIVKRLSPELTVGYPHVPWRRIAGFRDILIQDYDELDIEVVWRVVEEDLTPLKLAIEAMLKQVDDAD